MTPDETGAIKRSARMGLYVVAHVIVFFLWAMVSLWITMWAGLIVVPRMGRFVQDGLGVTSANAPSTEVFIAYWVAPLALIVMVLAAGVVALCVLAWRVRARAMSIVRRWVDRVAPVESAAEAQDEPGAAGGSMSTTKRTTKRVRSGSARQKN